MDARMVFTNSYGAKHSRTVEASTSMRMRSSMVTVAPILPSSSTVVVTSRRCGTFATTTGSCASSAPASIGSVAFLAPEMRTSPSRATPPWICSLSTSALPGLFGGEGLDRQGVDLPPHALAERAVHELVAREAAQLCELARDDACGEVGAIVRFHLYLRTGQAGTDQARDFFRVHVRDITWAGRGDAYNDLHGSASGRSAQLHAAGR